MLDVRALLTGDLQRMTHVDRYSHHRVSRKENVAEHTFYVAFYALAIASDIRRRGYDVDIETLMRRALVHDLDEAQTGDVVRDAKYADPECKRLWDNVAERLLQGLFQNLGIVGAGQNRETFMEDWQEAKGNDLEGAILKLCDFLSVVSYVYAEFMMGNRTIVPVFGQVGEYIRKDFKSLPEKFKEILRPYIEATSDVIANDVGSPLRIEL